LSSGDIYPSWGEETAKEFAAQRDAAERRAAELERKLLEARVVIHLAVFGSTNEWSAVAWRNWMDRAMKVLNDG
jgi:hypothetical protein